MAWTYSDYVTLDGADRLARLRLHIQEVSNKIEEERSAYGRSVSFNNLTTMLERLLDQEKVLGGQAPRRGMRGPRKVAVSFSEPVGMQ